MLTTDRLMKVLAILATVQLAACSDPESAGESSSVPAKPDALASLKATEGNSVSGTVSFYAADGGVRVSADINGLTEGLHGFHVHAKGDCSAADASSAGGHFNPKNVEHGAPGEDIHHTGDLGNIDANDNGLATLDQVFPFLALTGEDGILGKAVVVHADADDLESQPSGAAGARVACGVIREEAQ